MGHARIFSIRKALLIPRSLHRDDTKTLKHFRPLYNKDTHSLIKDLKTKRYTNNTQSERLDCHPCVRVKNSFATRANCWDAAATKSTPVPIPPPNFGDALAHELLAVAMHTRQIKILATANWWLLLLFFPSVRRLPRQCTLRGLISNHVLLCCYSAKLKTRLHARSLMAILSYCIDDADDADNHAATVVINALLAVPLPRSMIPFYLCACWRATCYSTFISFFVG